MVMIFFDLHRPIRLEDEANPPANSFDNSVMDNINSSLEELEFDFDFDDPAQRNVSKYVTVNQNFLMIRSPCFI